jgi:hypothetical protein
VLNNPGSAYSKAIDKLTRLLVPAEPKASQKRGMTFGSRQTSRPANSSHGLLGALRGKRAS